MRNKKSKWVSIKKLGFFDPNANKKSATIHTTKSVKRVLTLSKYYFGQHTFDEKSKGEYSFGESLSPIHFMLQELGAKTKLGSKIELTMKVIKEK